MAGLYVHIPFCHSKCAYCDFYSTPAQAPMPRVVDCLRKEMQLRRDEVAFRGTDTIYFGGGTPSILPNDMLAALARSATAMLSSAPVEFTIEVNPEDVTVEKAEFWRSLGINRVSMGVQSLIDSELSLINRRHTATQAIQAVKDLRHGGFDNISLDLIYGLPGQTLQSWAQSLQGMIDMQPQHLSAYMLSYEPGTRLTLQLQKGLISETDEATLVDMYELLCSEASKAGYRHYEISNFALPGLEAKHNSAYWHNVPYLGIGPSAHSYDGSMRRINPIGIKPYADKIESGFPAFEIDEENDDNRFNDLIITALRTAEGLPLASVPPSRLPQLMRDAQPHIDSGHLLLTPTHLHFTERSWLISDSLLPDLLSI